MFQGVTTKFICMSAGLDVAKIESFSEPRILVKFKVFEPSKIFVAPSTFTLQSSTQAGNLYPKSFGMTFILTKFNFPSAKDFSGVNETFTKKIPDCLSSLSKEMRTSFFSSGVHSSPSTEKISTDVSTSDKSSGQAPSGGLYCQVNMNDAASLKLSNQNSLTRLSKPKVSSE